MDVMFMVVVSVMVVIGVSLIGAGAWGLRKARLARKLKQAPPGAVTFTLHRGRAEKAPRSRDGRYKVKAVTWLAEQASGRAPNVEKPARRRPPHAKKRARHGSK